MISVAELKSNLELNNSLGAIIEALKSGSAIQLRQFQSKSKALEDAAPVLENVFAVLLRLGVKHPFLSGNPGLPACFVVVNTDNGFVGELNSAVANAAFESSGSERDVFVVLGERGWNFFEDKGRQFKRMPGLSEEIRPAEIRGLQSCLVRGFLKGEYGSVSIAYPQSVNVGAWKVRLDRLLPCGAEQDGEAGMPGSDFGEGVAAIEPSPGAVMEGLIRFRLSFFLYNIAWTSKFSEFGARLMHLEGSEQELARMKQQLSLQYFKHVHSLADKTIREIISSRLTRK